MGSQRVGQDWRDLACTNLGLERWNDFIRVEGKWVVGLQGWLLTVWPYVLGSQPPCPSVRAQSPEPPWQAPTAASYPPRGGNGAIIDGLCRGQSVNWNPLAWAVFTVTAATIHNKPLWPRLPRRCSGPCHPSPRLSSVPWHNPLHLHNLLPLHSPVTTAERASSQSSTQVWEMLEGTVKNSWIFPVHSLIANFSNSSQLLSHPHI